MPTGTPTFIQDANSNVANVTQIGQVKTNEVFDTLKPAYHESITAASGGTQLTDMEVGKLYLQSLSGNGMMYVGGLDTDAAFSGRGILLKPDTTPPMELPISNANKITVCATVSGQLITYWGFINGSNTILDASRQGIAPDTSGPIFLSSYPVDATTDVSLTVPTVYGYYNELLTSSTVNASSFIIRLSGDPETTMASGTPSTSGFTTTFALNSGQLQGLSWYNAYLTPVITDLVGNPAVTGTFSFKTAQAPDVTGPIYLSSNPVSGATDVGRTSAYIAYFNESIKSASINLSSFIVRKSGAAASTKASGTMTPVAGNDLAAQFVPYSGQITASAWYNVYLTPLIQDVAGNTMPISGGFAFRSEVGDITGPVLLSSDPLSGATGISVNTPTLYGYWNEALTSSTVDFSSFIVRLSGAAATTKISGTVAMTPPTGAVISFTAKSGLLGFASWYNAFLTGQNQDLFGNAATTGSFAFQTQAAPDTTGPVYLSSNPLSGSSNAETSGTYTAYFNEDLLDSTIDTSSFIVRLSGASASTMVAGTAQPSASNVKAAEFIPNSGQMQVSSWYRSFLTPRIKDVAGNVMPLTGFFSFLTRTVGTAPVVLSANPLAGAAGVLTTANVIVYMDKACSGTGTTAPSVISVTDISGNTHTGTVTHDGSTTQKVFTLDPSDTFNYSLLHTINVSGIYDTQGNIMTPSSANTFTTADPALNHFYSVTPSVTTHRFDSASSRHAEKRDNASSKFNGTAIRQVKVYLKRTTGTPNVTISCVVRKNIESNNGTLQATIGSMSSLSLTSSFALYTFTNLSNSYAMTTAGDALCIEASLTGSDEIGIETGTTFDGTLTIYSRFDTQWNDSSSEDLAGEMYS